MHWTGQTSTQGPVLHVDTGLGDDGDACHECLVSATSKADRRGQRSHDFKTFPTIEDIALPEPGLGEVLLKVAGAGARHSDVAMFDEFETDPNNGLMTPPRARPRNLRPS
jgi:hypothetical protein